MWIVIVRVESCSLVAVAYVLEHEAEATIGLRGHVSYLKEFVSDSEDMSCMEL